jgi:hypothetical protein
MRIFLLAAALLFAACESVRAFCGFYVAQAGGELLNRASKVVLAHRGERTVITMTSDIEGDPRQFALVVPVPTVVKREDVRLVQSRTIDHLESYTAPRLVEYVDPDPCAPIPVPVPMAAGGMMLRGARPQQRGADALGVKIEASYSVGEYDILVLSAADSGGLLIWLNRNGYKVPKAAEPTVGSYLRQNMRFFVAKVNLERQERQGSKFLRPIQVEYSSPKFMLPIRLGTVNADGPQEMIVLTLTERGRVETTNYRTVRVPTGTEVPLFVRTEFGPFYRSMFDKQVAEADGRAVFLEYAWDMNFCDPCSAPPLAGEELRELGAFWLGAQSTPGGGQPAFVTRLHVRYDRAHFPEDLALQETGDRNSFQARYVLQVPWKGDAQCEAATQYRASLPARAEQEARNLLELTNWTMTDVRGKMEAGGQPLRR